VSDIVAMLEQWELANFKPEYQFVDRQYAIGKAHSVSVLWRGGEVDAILEKEADVLQWMMRCSGIRRSRKAGCLKISRARIRGRSRVFLQNLAIASSLLLFPNKLSHAAPANQVKNLSRLFLLPTRGP
jgi:hypothetical protein